MTIPSIRFRFRDKLIAAFLLLLLATGLPVLLGVNRQIEVISAAKIDQDLRTAGRVFARFQAGQVATLSERARTFILTQPDIRAEIAGAGNTTESLFERILSGAGDPFAAPPPTAAPAERPGRAATGAAGAAVTPDAAEQQQRIRSVVQEVDLFHDAAVFFLVDDRGTLLFSKAAQPVRPAALGGLPAVRAALGGAEVFSWWAADDPRLAGLPLLPPAPVEGAGEGTLYRMFFKPVDFGGEAKGLLGIGFALTNADLHAITRIAQAEVAFLAAGRVYRNSEPAVPSAALLQVAHGTPGGDLEAAPIVAFASGGEDFLARSLPVLDSLGAAVGTVVVYRSKTREQAVFDRLRFVLNVAGLAALGVAVLLAFVLSHSVGRVVRQLFLGVRAVRQGDLEVRLDIHSRDEFGELGRAFNEMTAGLREKEQIRNTFRRYVSSTVVDELLRGADTVQLGGERKRLTIQFSDIAGFTVLSEALQPEQVVAMLNAYLSRMTAAVEAEQGIVDKYIGDAVMAFWGAPMPLADPAERACRAALRQLEQVAALRESWADRPELRGFEIRLGLHSGEVIVGNIGSDTRMDYTIIGDAVNIASRLEGANKLYGTHILVSAETLAEVRPGCFVTRELDRIQVVGRSAPVTVSELVGEVGQVPPERMAALERFAEGLADYRARRFEAAARCFKALAQAGDAPARVLLGRSEAYHRAPPPEDWQAVYRSESK